MCAISPMNSIAKPPAQAHDDAPDEAAQDREGLLGSTTN